MIPERALSNWDLIRLAKKLKIKNVRRVYMRDNLPFKPFENESAVVNLGSSSTEGSHWCCYKKLGNLVLYFDSFGNLPPPLELVNYFGPKVEIKYNYYRKQGFGSVVCGKLCLQFLSSR